MTEEQIRAGVVLAASRGVLSGLTSDESLGDAARSYRLVARTPEGDAFETAFEWARELKASSEKSLGLPRVVVAIRKAEASALVEIESMLASFRAEILQSGEFLGLGSPQAALNEFAWRLEEARRAKEAAARV